MIGSTKVAKLSRAGIAVAVIALMGACGGKVAEPAKKSPEAMKSSQSATSAAPASCEPAGASLSIAAKDVKFDKACLAAPAGQAFTIAFNNMEAVPHNIAILESHGSPNVLFPAEAPFTGPGTVTYHVGALKAGTFHFHCEVHPDLMQGTFVVK